jgi:outer membrane protein assembly factor BamB
MHQWLGTLLRILLAALLLACVQAFVQYGLPQNGDVRERTNTEPPPRADYLQLINATFLGNEKRNYYGDSLPDSLGVMWRCWLGKGTTVVSSEKGEEEWFGAGWTGQPLLVREGGRLMLLQGAFDHRLKKIDAATGALVWEYAFDDVIKGTATLWKNAATADTLNSLVVMQGSRAGCGLQSERAYSFRAVSYYSGAELWRMNVAHGPSYSRDCDASALVLGDTAYIGLENASFVKFLPGRTGTDTAQQSVYAVPEIMQQLPLSNDRDAALHGGNLVTEASPVRIGNHLYIASGAGHVFGYNLHTQSIDWDFYIGADLDGTPVVTADSCLLVPVEKQYIAGCGGVFKLNPRRAPEQCIDWYYPTGDAVFSGWKGGVVGSVAVNDAYRKNNDPYLAAFTGIDGRLCVVEWNRVRTDTSVTGPDGKTEFPCPQLVYSVTTGASISTPLFTQNRLLAAGYNGIRLFAYNAKGEFTLLSTHPGIFEATPVTHHGRVYVASRDGYLYCMGGGKTLPELILAESNNLPESTPEVTEINRPTISKPILASLSPSTNSSPQNKINTKQTLPIKSFIPQNTPAVHAQPVSPKNRLSHLVVGVFRSADNAGRSKDLWVSRGYRVNLLNKNNGMIYIIIDTDKIISTLEEINEKYNANAWILST